MRKNETEKTTNEAISGPIDKINFVPNNEIKIVPDDETILVPFDREQLLDQIISKLQKGALDPNELEFLNLTINLSERERDLLRLISPRGNFKNTGRW